MYEPILHDTERIALYPIQREDIWEYYKKHISTFWTPNEVDMSTDLTDWENKLTQNERHYIEMVLGFFAMSDFIVNENLTTNFIEHIKLPELVIYYRFQMMMEDIHSTTYADILNALVNNRDRKNELFHAVITIPIVKRKAEWARRYIYQEGLDEVEQFVTRLVVFSVVEGIFFSGSFCSIFWLKKRGLMKGLTFSNELISKDEGLHRDLACHVYKSLIKNKLSDDKVISIVKDGVLLEQEFVSDALPVELIGMNATLMKQYIEYVADHLLLNLIGKRTFYTDNPFDWMTLISLQGKTNFFESRVSAYQKAEIGAIAFGGDF